MKNIIKNRFLTRIFGLPILVSLLSGVAWASAPQPGAEQLEAYRRIQCSLVDGKPAVYGWHGRVYSRVPGEKDRLLFRVEGMNIRQCGSVEDEVKGTGFKMVSREILLYQDPTTGAVLDSWTNPWTGQELEVWHVANDPVNQPPMFPVGRGGKPFAMPFSIQGDQWWLTSTIPLFYTNALGGDYQEFVGGTYHATEMFNFMGDVKDLKSGAGDSAAIRVGWVRLSSWLPWMKMGDRAGILYFHTAGRKLESYNDLSSVMKQQIVENFPLYNEPPPLDDKRPNETSWTYFKKIIDAGKK